MIFQDVEGFREALPAGPGGLLGVDTGEKTVGLALSDRMRVIASPLIGLRRTKFSALLSAFEALVAEHRIVGLVLGLPVNMNGTEGPRCQSVRQFARNVEGPLGLPVLLWDERLSTAAVTRTLLEADMSRARRAEVVDKMAAAYILQGALDRLKSEQPTLR